MNHAEMKKIYDDKEMLRRPVWEIFVSNGSYATMRNLLFEQELDLTLDFEWGEGDEDLIRQEVEGLSEEGKRIYAILYAEGYTNKVLNLPLEEFLSEFGEEQYQEFLDLDSIDLKTGGEVVKFSEVWQELEDIPTVVNKNSVTVIDADFLCFKRGTELEELWHCLEASFRGLILGEVINNYPDWEKSYGDLTTTIEEMSEYVEQI